MIKIGDVVSKVIIYKSNNINDEGIDGYEIGIEFQNGEQCEYIEYTIDELEDQPRGIYEYVDGKYVQIENWDK